MENLEIYRRHFLSCRVRSQKHAPGYKDGMNEFIYTYKVSLFTERGKHAHFNVTYFLNMFFSPRP